MGVIRNFEGIILAVFSRSHWIILDFFFKVFEEFVGLIDFLDF